RLLRAEFLDGLRVLLEFLDVDHANRIAAFHREVVLRRDDEVRLAGPGQLGAAVEPRRVRRAQPERVVADLVADAAGTPAPVPEMHHDHVVGRAGHDPDGDARLAALIGDLDDVLAAVARAGGFRRRNAESLLRRAHADVGDVVP